MENLNGAIRSRANWDLWEYLLVACPTREVLNRVVAEKEMFYESYGYKPDIQTLPHITIAGFLAKEAMEETLSRWIQNVCNLQNSFTVHLNNYSGFPPHTIYLRIQNAEPFKKLTNALKILDGFIQSNECPPLQLVSKPHLTIAGNLPQLLYDTAIKEYSCKIFHESFKVEKLILLKRDAYMTCHQINTFVLPSALTE